MLLRTETTPQPRIYPFHGSPLDPPRNQMRSTPMGLDPQIQPPLVTLTTAGQTSILLIFGTILPLTSLMATTTIASTHYSTILTTTRGTINEYDVHLTDYDSSEESYRDLIFPHIGGGTITATKVLDTVLGKKNPSPVDQ